MMIRLTILIMPLVLGCQLLSGQTRWSEWEELYHDSYLKVEIRFKLYADNCQSGSKSSKYQYQITGFHPSKQYINWKMDYVGCNGNVYMVQRSLQIERNSATYIKESMDYTFTSRTVEKLYYDARLSNREETANKVLADAKSIPADRIEGLGNSSPGNLVKLKQMGGSLGKGAQWYWYREGCGVELIGSGSEIEVKPDITTVYFLRAEGDGNVTPCVNHTVIVDPNSLPPNRIITENAVCEGGAVVLSLDGGTLGKNADWVWYTGSCGSNEVGRGVRVVHYPTETTTYFVRAEGETNITLCVSTTVEVKKQSATPSDVTASKSKICEGEEVVVRLLGQSTVSGANWSWYAGRCGGLKIGTGSSVRYSPKETTTLYVRDESGCKPSECKSITVQVIQNSKIPDYIQASPSRFSKRDQVTLSAVGGQLGQNSEWKWRKGACGKGVSAGTGYSIEVKPGKSEMYTVRAESACGETDCRTISLNAEKTHKFHPFSKHEGYDNKKLQIGIGIGLESIVFSAFEQERDLIGIGLRSQFSLHPLYLKKFKWGIEGGFSIGTTPLWIIGGDRKTESGRREERYLYSIIGVGTELVFTSGLSGIDFLLQYRNDFHYQDFHRQIFSGSTGVVQEKYEMDKQLRREYLVGGFRLGPYRMGGSERGLYMDMAYTISRDFSWSWSRFDWNYAALSNWQQGVSVGVWMESLLKIMVDVSWNTLMGEKVDEDNTDQRTSYYGITLMYSRNAFK